MFDMVVTRDTQADINKRQKLEAGDTDGVSTKDQIQHRLSKVDMSSYREFEEARRKLRDGHGSLRK